MDFYVKKDPYFGLIFNTIAKHVDQEKNKRVNFFAKQNKKVKIIWTLELIKDVQIVPETYLKQIQNTNGLYEIRVQFANDIFRIFCFF
jgi:hypothetical protein